MLGSGKGMMVILGPRDDDAGNFGEGPVGEGDAGALGRRYWVTEISSQGYKEYPRGASCNFQLHLILCVHVKVAETPYYL